MEIIKKNLRDITNFIDCSFELTSKCNFKCIHCYNGKNNTNDLNLEQISIALHRIKELGVLELLLTGGEILLREDILLIIDLCHKLGFKTTLYSNGSLLTEKIAKRISKYNMCIEISIYGSNEETYEAVTGSKKNYKRVLNALHILEFYNVNFKTKSVIMNQNYNDFSNIYNMIKRFNGESGEYGDISCFIFGDQEKMNNCRLNESKTRYILDKYEYCKTNSSKYGFCTAMKNQFAIDNRGYVNTCLGWRSISFGSILDDDWREKIIEAAIPFRKELQNTIIKCNSCEISDYCIICPMTFYQDTGSHRKYSKESCKFAKIRKDIYESRIKQQGKIFKD